ncbi:cilia- and flagella-associated protein 44 [Nomia melanderi]|uniref:cilia- and flagella-associated protein 44 n=1 Tax=Nomia melanderi TaxID=2448451 RepID=UPI001304133C|nr:cilia- and flagella-associated protein 44 [Nomia melanderi]
MVRGFVKNKMADGGKDEFENEEDQNLTENTDDEIIWKNDSDLHKYEEKKLIENSEEENIYSEDTEEYSFLARKPKHGTISQNFLEFFHSYAYDCQKFFNLCVVNKDIIAFTSGNLIHFLNVTENTISFKRSSMGGGIGHISKNPTAEHFAVAENGIKPVIIIYGWPSMRIITVLKGGTTKRYLHLAYSPDGLLLISQGGEPDYFISLWNWKDYTIILQCKSYIQDVYNVTFSKYIPGQLTSSGSGHIKFWKVSKTFTGLKLKGQTGKFGNTEISDIIGIHPMPNETVISGCEWGNILLWDENLIKLEACRKNKEPAHTNYIIQFEYISGELISVGLDGWIRFWFYDTIDHADLPDGEQLLELQPIYEFHITEGEKHSQKNAMLMSIQKKEPNDSEKTIWYAQDGNGGLWLLDLCTNKKEHLQKKIFTCHAGPIIDMDKANWGPFIASLDKSGQLHIYNYVEKKLIVVYMFHDKGSQVVWLPPQIEKTGSTIICAFQSGIIRMITVAVKVADTENNIKGDYTRLIQILKPHSMPISVMSYNISCSLLITGSEDATVFIFNIHSTKTYPEIIPIGYVKVPSSVTCMQWNPLEEATLLIGCFKGDCVEVQLPTTPQSYTTTSYELVKCKWAKFKFESVKSSIQREMVIKKYEEEKKRKITEKKKEIEQLLIENPHIVIDEETFFAEFNKEKIILPEIHVPEIPNRILIVEYGTNENIWLFVAGFDAGYVYEYPRPLSGKIKDGKPINSRIIENAEDMEMHNCFFYNNKKYLFLGTQYGELYVCKMKNNDPLDFSDYWILPVHDYYNGHISKMLLSYDEKMLLTCGYDGNIFSFMINDNAAGESVEIPVIEDPLPLPKSIEDIEDADYPSLEEVITQMERNRIISFAEKKKEEILLNIRGLVEEYVQIINRNKKLLPSQQIQQFELDPRITEDLEQHLKEQIVLTQGKLEFQAEKSKLELEKLIDHFVTPVTCLPFAVCSILNENKAVHSIRELKLNIDKISKHVGVAERFEEQQQVHKIIQKEMEDIKEETDEEEIHYLEGFLDENYSDLTSGLGIQINQILLKYKEKKANLIQRQKEWQKLHSRKPNLAKSRMEDAIFVEKTKRAIGEYNLKTTTGFNLAIKKQTAAIKYKQLLDCRSKLHHLREEFNAKLNAVKVKKQKLQAEVIKLIETLKRIHAEIPFKSMKPLPHPPKLDFDIEFPEHKLELEKYISMTEKVQQVKRQRRSSTMDLPVDQVDLEYEVLLCDDKMTLGEEIESLSTLVSSSKMKIKDHLSTQTDLIRNLNTSDAVQTSWEREMKRARMWRKIYEQDCILRYISDSYKQLEYELNNLEEYRLDVVYQSAYMNLYLLTLYEEFIILRECEAAEYTLEEKVNQKSNEHAVLTLKIQTTNIKIVTREEEIRKLHSKIKEIATEFTRVIARNKFYDFLQKVFKKKSTAMKERNGSADTVTQSSETSTDETNSTVDSETEQILFDENICPPGCDKQLYEMTLSMREKRYTCESQIREEQKEIELLYKELDADTKSLRIVENNLRINQEDLKKFMVEKQKKLNNIDVTIVLKMHQLQHIDSGCTTEIQDCVVFNRQELSNLYARVGELQKETLDLAEQRKKNETHLKRIKLDLKYMEAQNKKLELEIKEKMIQKFGRKVSLINLYEIVLQRLIYETKTDIHKIMKNFSEDMKNVKRDCNEGLIVLTNLIRNNTEKVSLLTVLEKEKIKLKKILKQLPISEESMLQVELQHQADIAALESILHSQVQQKHLLQYDVGNLRNRPKKLLHTSVKENVL